MLDARGESAERDTAAALATIFGEEAPAEVIKRTCTLGPRAAPLSIKLRRYRQDHGRWVESRDRAEGEVFLVVEGPGGEERVRADWASLRNPTRRGRSSAPRSLSG